jgi:hypothetical protein
LEFWRPLPAEAALAYENGRRRCRSQNGNRLSKRTARQQFLSGPLAWVTIERFAMTGGEPAEKIAGGEYGSIPAVLF